LLGLARNEECFCGSGRKYKRCCLPEIEAAEAAIRREFRDKHPDVVLPAGLLELLGAAVGLAANDPGLPKETPLPLAAALEALGRVALALSGDDEASDAAMGELQRSFDHSLRNHRSLRGVRYDPTALSEHLAAAPTGPSNAGDAAMRIAIIIRKLANPGLRGAFALNLLATLRDSPGPAEVGGLVWGAWCLAEDRRAEDNPFWGAVYDATLDELAAAQDELREILDDQAAETPGRPDRLADCLRRYPVMDRRLYHLVKQDVAEALQAIREGKIDLAYPAWAILGGLRHWRGVAAQLERLAMELASDQERQRDPAQRRRTNETLAAAQEAFLRGLHRIAVEVDWSPSSSTRCVPWCGTPSERTSR